MEEKEEWEKGNSFEEGEIGEGAKIEKRDRRKGRDRMRIPK